MSSLPSRILVTGASGFLGRHVVRRLRTAGVDVITPAHAELDLAAPGADQRLAAIEFDALVHLAAFFGGVHFVSAQADEVSRRNRAINAAVVGALTARSNTRAVLALSACMYPERLAGPATENQLLAGPMHPSVAAFGETKRMLLRWGLSQPLRQVAMPVFTTVYGPGDHFGDATRSHFLGGLLGRLRAARDAREPRCTVWGSGRPVRDVVHVEDAARAVVRLLQDGVSGPFNVSAGEPMTILEYARACAAAIGYEGEVIPDPTRADGQMYKAIDARKLISTGWAPSISLDDGLRATVASMGSSDSEARA